MTGGEGAWKGYSLAALLANKTYYPWLRCHGEDGSSDSFHYQKNDGDIISHPTWSANHGVLTWIPVLADSNGDNSISLGDPKATFVNTDTFKHYIREGGNYIDAIAFIDNPNVTPTGKDGFIAIAGTDFPAGVEVNAGVDISSVPLADNTLNPTVLNPNGFGLEYIWSVEVGPDTSDSQFDDTSALNAVFTPSKPGAYQLRFGVKEAGNASSEMISGTLNATVSAWVFPAGLSMAAVKASDTVLLDGAKTVQFDVTDLTGGYYDSSVQFARSENGNGKVNILHDTLTSEQIDTNTTRYSVDVLGTQVGDGVEIVLWLIKGDFENIYSVDSTAIEVLGSSNATWPDGVSISLTDINDAVQYQPSVIGAQLFNTYGFDVDYAWSVVSGPSTDVAQFIDPTIKIAEFVPLLPGDYVLQLTVTEQGSAANPISKTMNLTAIEADDDRIFINVGPVKIIKVGDTDVIKVMVGDKQIYP